MSFGIISFAIVLVAIFLFYWKKQQRILGSLPPGPFSLPVVGYYPFLGTKPYVQLAKLKRKYGGVFSLRLGSRVFLIIQDVETLKNAYHKEAFLGRPPYSSFRIIKRTKSLVEYNGVQWSEQRRFTLKVLRNLGFGKTRMEDVIKEEAKLLLLEYEKHDKSPTSMKTLVDWSTANVISVLVFGRRFAFSDSTRRVIDHYLQHVSKMYTPISFHSCFPWLRKILVHLGLRIANVDYAVGSQCINDIIDFNWNEISVHEKNDSEENRDYVDSYLLEAKKYENSSVFNKSNLNGNMQLFLRAGSLTSRAVLQWSLLACAAYPKIQAKIQAEINNTVGENNLPNWSHRDHMPYTQAFLLEIQRWKTIVPINILRCTTSETTLNGYNIPAGTIVLSNLWAIHNDQDLWEQPEELKPERFLSKDGSKIEKTDGFVSFSIGRRACPGQSLANMEMFLYLTTILQKYDCVLPPGEKGNFEGQPYASFEPKYFRILLKRRNGSCSVVS